MKQLKTLFLLLFAMLTATEATAQYTHYSEWVANSRNYKVYKSGSYKTFSSSTGNSGDFWRYDDGLMYEAILDTYHRYNTNTTFLEGVRDYLKWCFQGSSSPYIDNLETTTLDDMRPGRLVWKYKRTYSHSDTDYDSKYEAALSALMQTSAFANSSRVTINGNTGKGYPWRHKSGLSGQVWLDGIFMGLPFWTLAGPVIGSGRDEYSSWTTSDFFEDAVSQILKTDEKTYGDELGLWAHAWDGEGDEAWSTKNSSFTTGSNVPPHADVEEYAHDGRSSHCWGRALGWYAMAIMETMDNIQLQNGSGTYNTQINTLKPIFKKVMDKVIETRDPSSGVWYCVLDVGDNSSATSPYYGKGPKNNYLEATCSSMFAYCLLHGVAQGYLDTSYTTVAQDVYNSVVTQFIKDDSGNKKLINCDQVAGLGGTSTVDGTTYNRDGSFAYYMLEKKIDNDSKGIGPFIWASLAAETTPYNYTISTGFPSIESNGIVQFRWSKVADNITTPSSYVSPTFTAKTYGGTTLTNSSDITYVSDNTAVATVDANGTITLAGEAGTANIKATMKSGAYVGEAIYTVTTTGTDTTKPTLSSSTPTTGATDVAVSGNIVLTFSEDVTINDASNITLTGGSGTLNTASATVDGATITIPYSGLANSTNYTLSVDAGAVKDLTDNTNEAVNAITFTTIAPDETAPTLSSQSIANNATNVSTSGTIVLTFSEEVTCTTNATLTPAGGSAVNLTPTVSGSTVTYSYSGLSNETSYTFNLAANSVADLAGNNYASAVNFSFTTAAASAEPTTIFSFEVNSDGSDISVARNGGTQELTTTNAFSTLTGGTVTVKNDNTNSGGPDKMVGKDNSERHIRFTNTSQCVIISLSKTLAEGDEITFSSNGSAQISFTTTDSRSTSISTSNGSYTIPTGSALINASTLYVWPASTSTKIKTLTITRSGSTPTPTTYTLTNAVNTEGYGTVSPASVASIPSGTATTSSSNTYTVNGTTVTATPTAATDEYTYTFSGWSGLPETVSANATVTANFTRTPKEYTLAWNKNAEDADDLTGNYTNGSTAYGTTLTPPSTPTRDGYTFTGWNSAQNGSGTAPTGTMPAANTTYYAQWTENTPVVEQVATPAISGTTPFTESTTATITCDTDGATIHYTTDGSTPTASSTTYSSPIAISATTTVKAIAVKSGMTDSEVASATFTKSGGGGGTSATITYNLTTNTSSTTFNSCASVSPTSGDIIASSTINTYGSAGASSSNSAKADETQKLNIDNSYTANNYYEWTFTVGNGKNFSPSQVVMKFQAVSDLVQYKVDLTDGTTTYTTNFANTVSTAETLEQLTWNITPTAELTGTVRLKLWAYKKNNSASAFRLGSPITITGSVGEASLAAPTFTAHPANATYTQGDTPTALSVTATGNPAPTYQWYKNTDNDKTAKVADQIEGATAATLPVANISTETAGTFYYYCVATNSEGTATSNSATITVNAPALAISTQPIGASYTQDDTATALSVTATGGSTPYSYQWYSNDTNDTETPTAVGTNSDSYTPSTTTVGTTYYYCVVTDNASATVTSNIVAITVNTSGGGSGSGTVLFSQDFNDATEVAYAASTAQAITSGNNIVGTDDPSTKFTSITCNKKDDTGIGINSTTGGNSKDYTGKFGAFYNNTSGYWSIVKTTSFASTTPTAIKVEMNAAFSPVTSGSNIGVQFAVGSEFTDELTNTCPALSNCVAGFALPSNNNIRVAKYSTSNANTAINSSSATITNGDSYKYTWIINNTDETLTYKGADGNNTTVAAGCWDLWIGTSRNLAGISQSTTGMSGTSLENIYIGSPFGKKHEFILDDIVVTDLSPAAMRTTTATIKAGKQYATFNTTMDIDFDETEGLQAFVVDNATKSSVHLREVTVVPANTALIIKGAPDTYTLYETKKATESVSDNQLTISNSTVAADNMYYALGTVNGVQGFHRVQNGLTIPTSYVIITDQTAKSFLNFEEEENIATGIDGFATDNGFIVIDDNTPLYNLSGQRVSKSYKGIVIINGKKVLRK